MPVVAPEPHPPKPPPTPDVNVVWAIGEREGIGMAPVSMHITGALRSSRAIAYATRKRNSLL